MGAFAIINALFYTIFCHRALFFMNNINFIKYLQNLTDDRFALTCLDHNEYRTFHALLLATFTDSDSQQIIHSSNPTADWYLLGTDGCHLCHASHALLTQVRVIYPHMPTVHVLELTIWACSSPYLLPPPACCAIRLVSWMSFIFCQIITTNTSNK